MVSQKQISSWLPKAIELFNQYMPGLDTDAILFQIVSPKTLEKTRAKIMEELDSPQNDSNPNALFEFLFGSNGTAVLIKQQYVKDERQFQEMLWHELGHAYAYQYEYPGYHLIDKTILANHQISKEFVDFYIGYLFWKEFIAESISCFVASKVYPVGDISDNWYPHADPLFFYLHVALSNEGIRLNEGVLGMYFAHLLMGAGEKQFFDKATNGGLKVGDVLNNYHPSRPGEIDGYRLEEKKYRETLIILHEHLIPQMSKPNFWSVTPDFISRCGEIIIYDISAVKQPQK